MCHADGPSRRRCSKGSWKCGSGTPKRVMAGDEDLGGLFTGAEAVWLPEIAKEGSVGREEENKGQILME